MLGVLMGLVATLGSLAALPETYTQIMGEWVGLWLWWG